MHPGDRQGAIAAQAGPGLDGEVGRRRNRAIHKEIGTVFNRCGARIGAVTGEIGVAACGAVLGIADHEGAVATDQTGQFGSYTVAIDGVSYIGICWCC